MPNVAALLKEEITRLARREVRVETTKLAKASATYRHDIATLKRRIAELEREVGRLSKAANRQAPGQASTDGRQVRYSAKNLAALRKKLDLSAVQMGKLLLGVSAQTVRNYEKGDTRPGKEAILAIAQLRRMGKREVAELLAAL